MAASNKKDVIDTYFDFNVFVLKVAGIWCDDGPNKSRASHRLLRHVYNTFWIVYCLFLYQPCETAVTFRTFDLSKIVRSLRDQLNHISCIFKLIVWFANRKTIVAIMRTLQSRRFEYDDLGDVDGNRCFATNDIYKRHQTESNVWSKIFLLGVNSICLNMCVSILYVFLFFHEQQYVVDHDGTSIYGQPFAVDLVLPYKVSNRLVFILTFAFQVIALDIYGWMIIGLDTLFTSLMSCISAHLCIIQEAFKTIRPRCMKRLKLAPQPEMLRDTAELNREIRLEMRKCTQHLQMIIEVSAKLEYVYNIQTCGQVLTSLFEMCFCLFLLSTSFDENFGPEFTYLFSTAFELLLYCWFGNSVTEASKAIPEALFDGDWLSTSTPFKKDMLITMTRMRRPICMTIAKFTPLTFTTFLSIGRVAYSFFTVLKSATN